MSLAKRLEKRVYYVITCSYCGYVVSTREQVTREVAAIWYAANGWAPHPRCITSVLCYRCATLYPDTRSIDLDIESEIPF